MTELLGRVTSMPVTQATDSTVLEPDHVYVIPPKKEMILVGDRLLLTDKDPRNAPSLPIDTFLRSMAQEAGARSIAIILSGTGSDGGRGVREVKAAGGRVIVQDPADAEFDGMPENALAAGVADAVLPAADIPAEISRLLPELSLERPSADPAAIIDARMQRILNALAEAHDVDFSCYKTTTLTRRIKRRMELAGVADVERYAMLIASDAQESKRLYHDLLIGVTEFFRDPESYEELAAAARQNLFSDEAASEVRVWVAGCATGEEVYSVAIVLDEARAASRSAARIKLFATDIHQEALKQASAGVYPREALAGVSAERRSRYFSDEGNQIRVADFLREMVVFATHNLVTDAPFTQLDMICCRNVLIYFQPATQARVVALFHFGLRTGGLLFLGPSETLGKLEDEFESISTKGKIFCKHRDLRLASHPGFARLEVGPRRREARGVPVRENGMPEAYEVLLSRYMPPAFLLDENFNLLHCFGGGEKLLSFKGGRLSTSVASLLEGRIKTAVSGLIERFKHDPNSAHAVNLRREACDAEAADDYRVTILPVPLKRASRTNVLIEIRPLQEQTGPQAPGRAAEPEVVASEYVESLEHDLELARGQLQTTVEELEAANEELQAANEELVASNEELQSTNEELRSVNEELNTVNVDHQNKIAQLTEVTEDLEKLLHTINVGVLFLDPDMCIRRANQRIAELLHILPRDIGRSFEHFKNNLDAPGVFETAIAVLKDGKAAEQEVRTSTGRVLLVNVLPYSDRPIKKGVVVTIVDITTLKAAETEAERLSSVVRHARDAIISETLDGIILSWNAGAERLYGYKEKEAIGQHIGLIVPEDRMAEVLSVFREVERGHDVPPFETVRMTKSGGRVDVLLSVAPIRSESGRVTGVSMISLDITERKQAEERAQIAVEQRDKFLALLSHELRNPLMALSSANELLIRSDGNSETARRAQQLISRQITQMSRLLEDTLDASRMRHDKIELHRRQTDLRTVIETVVDGAKGRAEEEDIRLAVSLPDAPVPVEADPTRLHQAVVNLVQNAINHSSAGQCVDLELRIENNGAVVRVEDDGAGIAPEALPKLFEPFFQGSRRSRHGMGLGLSLARSVVRAHGGEITAASPGLGQGASFLIRLPLAEENTESGAELPATANGCADKATILLVDDDDASRESIGALLRSSGYNVLEAGNGTDGLRLIAEANPSVAVIDVGLPDISGLEVARRVRSSRGGQQIRLIALTGFGRQADREAAIEAGCDMHLVKPIDFTTLERVIAYQAAR